MLNKGKVHYAQVYLNISQSLANYCVRKSEWTLKFAK